MLYNYYTFGSASPSTDSHWRTKSTTSLTVLWYFRGILITSTVVPYHPTNAISVSRYELPARIGIRLIQISFGGTIWHLPFYLTKAQRLGMRRESFVIGVQYSNYTYEQVFPAYPQSLQWIYTYSDTHLKLYYSSNDYSVGWVQWVIPGTISVVSRTPLRSSSSSGFRPYRLVTCYWLSVILNPSPRPSSSDIIWSTVAEQWFNPSPPSMPSIEKPAYYILHA